MSDNPFVLHVSVECYPAAKVGGLADVVGALPRYQKKLGWQTAVIMPWYENEWFRKQQWEVAFEGSCKLGSRTLEFEIRSRKSDEQELYAVYFPHGPQPRRVYDDPEIEHDLFHWFLRFQVAILTWIRQMKPQPTLIHCHDHHTALIPFMMTRSFAFRELDSIPTVLTVHNGRYHGAVPLARFHDLPAFDLDDIGLLEWDGKLNPLATGLKTAWHITTVSKGYLKELMTGEDPLKSLYQHEQAKCTGIVNGIDTDSWDPAADPMLDEHYNQTTVRQGKAANKIKLAEEFDFSADQPLLTFIGRLVFEKGADLLPDLLREIRENTKLPNVQIFVLGSGEQAIEDRLQQVANEFEQISLVLGYHEALAHRLYAASDFIFMPSRVEPCGLNQLYAMRYGAIPIVRRVGGLRDTVEPITKVADPQGEGFGFEEFSIAAAHGAIKEALLLYQQKARVEQVRKRIMAKELSWEHSAQQYITIYEQLKT
jgi:starch synthase